MRARNKQAKRQDFGQFYYKQDSSRKCSAWKDLRFKFLSFKFPTM